MCQILRWLRLCDIKNKQTTFTTFLCQVPYYVDGKETGLTYGLTDDLCSTTINNGATWRTTSTWGSTALTSATPLHVRVHVLRLMLISCGWSLCYYYPSLCTNFKCFTTPLAFIELNPPEGKTRDALFQIVCRDGRVISLCADSADDAL